MDDPDEIPESELDSVSETVSELNSINKKISIRHSLDYVEGYLRKLSSISSNLPQNQSFCHTILCHGVDSVTLRLIELIFGIKIAIKFCQDVHLIRSNHLPNLIDKSLIPCLISSIDDAHYLNFLRIYYLQDYQHLVKHLLSISTANKNQLLPIAFIIDDIYPFIWQGLADDTDDEDSKDSQDDPSMGSRKRPRLDQVDEQWLLLMRCCSLLTETIEYCASKLKQNTYLIMNVNLNQFYSYDRTKQQDLLRKMKRRYFTNQINVDSLDC